MGRQDLPQGHSREAMVNKAYLRGRLSCRWASHGRGGSWHLGAVDRNQSPASRLGNIAFLDLDLERNLPAVPDLADSWDD